MTSAQSHPHLNPQDYLAWERQQETRHEYVNGEIHAMTGASREHNLINGNLFAALHTQTRGKPCEVYSNDMRVKVSETGMYTYPDIAVACGKPEFEDTQVDTLLNPVLIVEVLKVSTEGYDRGAKFAHYRTLPSFARLSAHRAERMPRGALRPPSRPPLVAHRLSGDGRDGEPDRDRLRVALTGSV